MKRIIYLLLLIVSTLTSCAHDNYSELNITQIEKIIVDNAPTEFEYSDVSDYYLNSYFKSLPAVLEAKICVCNDSSNFNEYGIFRFESENDAQNALGTVRNYLYSAKSEFENGIIYDIEEYPKFENATAKRFGKYVVYTILNKKDSENIYSILKEK